MKKIISRVAFAAAVGLSLGGCATADSVGNWGSDAWVTSKVKTNITNEVGLTAATQVNVETSGGVVQLSGFASTQDEINKAVATAQKTSGVKSVRNNIILKR
jgi:osmotically-inducible protein OsmY